MAIGKMVKKAIEDLGDQAGRQHSSAPTPQRVNTTSSRGMAGASPTGTAIRTDKGVRENEGSRRRRERMGGADANIIRTEASHTGYRE